jgi:hypothetical protein
LPKGLQRPQESLRADVFGVFFGVQFAEGEEVDARRVFFIDRRFGRRIAEPDVSHQFAVGR